MKQTKLLAFFLTAVMAVGAFTGCQGNTSQAEPSEDIKYLLSEKTEYEYFLFLARKNVTKYSYNDKGLLISEESSDGNKILYEYNDDGKVIKETSYNADGEENYCHHT